MVMFIHHEYDWLLGMGTNSLAVERQKHSRCVYIARIAQRGAARRGVSARCASARCALRALRVIAIAGNAMQRAAHMETSLNSLQDCCSIYFILLHVKPKLQYKINVAMK